jgi:nucleotide-binding universal stress UspA family protein
MTRNNLMMHLGLLLLAAAGLPAAGDEPRWEESLNGQWQYQIVPELGSPPASGRWKDCAVPGYFQGTDYQRAWLRRRFSLPTAVRGKRLAIHFGGVKFNSRVFVNGRPVGGCFGGYEPFEVDVTDAVRWDGPNELAVGCHDWTGVFTPGRVTLPPAAAWDTLRSSPRDKILSPIGGLFGSYGIWDDVTLRARVPVCASDLFIRPSVRRGELVVEYTLANQSPREAEVELRAAVEDGGREVLAFSPARVSVPAGGTAPVTVRRTWKNPPLWSPADPHLLYLRTELSTGDRIRTRFGFREFWVEGPRFYLNGARINLLASSWWPPTGPMTREEIRGRWEAVKRLGAVAFRTHTQPWPELHYDVADEVGLLMIVEGAVWNDRDVYRIHDPAFWENYGRHLAAMVRRDRNRPSVILWSLENEFSGGRLTDASPAKKDLVRMGRLVRQCDPTRPLYFESDGDPDGVSDLIGIHYPHEYPDFTCWPNEAGWLRRPAAVSGFLNGQKEFFWRKDKPLYLGEFLWVPSRDPSWHTVFFGDQAYLDYHRYRDLAKAEAWKMQILGYRRLEVGGLSPWTVIEGGPLDASNPLYRAQQYACQHVAAYPVSYCPRFYGGQTVARRLAVFNDLIEPSALELRWSLDGGQPAVGSGQSAASNSAHAGWQSRRLDLSPGQQQTVEVDLPLLPVSARTSLSWRLVLLRNGAPVFRDTHELIVFPGRGTPAPPGLEPAAPPAAVGLFDPQGTTGRWFQSQNVPTRSVEGLAHIPEGIDLLVIGQGALGARAGRRPVIGQVLPERAALMGFAGRGGRVLVLRQDAYPEGLVDLTLTGHASTMTFPVDAAHGALRRVRPEDLKFWRTDHLVAVHEPARPARGGFVPIVVSGSAAGIDHAPLVEQRIGRGAIVFCQLMLIEKLADEPAAAQLLESLVDYLRRYRAAARKTALVGGSPAYRALLRSLGLRFEQLSGDVSGADLSRYGLVICAPGSQPPPSADWVEAGGSLVVHRPTADTVARLSRAFRLGLDTRAYAGPVTRAEDDAPLLPALLREDLYWLGRHEGIDWSETPRAEGMAELVFSKTMAEGQGTVYPIDDWKLEGEMVARQPPGVEFATVGTASASIDFPAEGDYLVGLVARGTPCHGVYPIAQVTIDDRLFGSVSVSGQWSTVAVSGRVARGRHKLSVSFTNDASDPPREDRNLYVRSVLVARDTDPGRARFLTSPAAVAVAPRGRGMVVLDALGWDTEQSNARKAARYAATLLTALGGDFQPRPGVMLPCGQMTPQPGMPLFSNRDGIASLPCNGYVAAPIQVAAGRRYTMELVASGTPALGVYPLVEVAIDGKLAGQIQLTGGAWRSYFLDLDLPPGAHELRLSFVNDFCTATEDRNLLLDKVHFWWE